jgi:hypothetical protein
MPVVGRRGLPAVVDDGRGTGLGDDRRAGDGFAGREGFAAVEGARAERSGGSVMPVASTERASTTIGRSRVKEYVAR